MNNDNALFFGAFLAIAMVDILFFVNSFQYSGVSFFLGFFFLLLAHLAIRQARAELK